jgi:hypothetical protein
MEIHHTDHMTQPELLVVLQSHSITDNQKILGFVDNHKLRYVGHDKATVSKVCFTSLCESLKRLKRKYSNNSVKLHVIDDRSSPDVLDHFHMHIQDLNAHGVQATLAALDGEGLLHSCRRQYEYGRDHGADLVYFAQDDYLFYPDALTLMVEQYTVCTPIVGAPVSIFPYNDPHEYILENSALKCNLIQGSDRYWRTCIHPACCFMTHVDVVRTHWDLFDAFWQHEVNDTMELDTISRLFWERQLVLLVPIPSLALHLQYETEKDPFLDWQILWDHYHKQTPLDVTSPWQQYNK